jgi:hypothetical protein
VPKKLYRLGECKRCGKCCYMYNLVTAPSLKRTITPEMRRVLKTSAGKNIVCRYLSYDKNKLATCLAFDKPERPTACSFHPGSPESLTEGCEGYTFIYERDNS